MALTGASAASSDFYEKLSSVGAARSSVRPDESGGRKRVIKFEHTVVDGDGSAGELVTDDEMNLCVLPPNCSVNLKASYVKISASQGANTLLNIGFRAYTKEDGSLATEDADALGAAIGSTTTIQQIYALTPGSPIAGNPAIDTLGWIRFSSRTPIVLFQKAADSTGTFDGDVGDIYSYEIEYVVD